MSDIEKLVKELEDTHRIIKGLADNSMCNLYREANSINEAISTIKELSAKYDRAVADVVKLSTQDIAETCTYIKESENMGKTSSLCDEIIENELQQIIEAEKNGGVDIDIGKDTMKFVNLVLDFRERLEVKK